VPHRHRADGIHQTPDNEFIRQQLQGPVAPPPRWITTSPFDHLLFDRSLDLDLVRPRRLGPVVPSGLETFGNEALPHPLDRPPAGAQSRDNLGIRTSVALLLVRQEQKAGMGQLAGGCLTHRNYLLQGIAFFRGESAPILVHRGTPLLETLSVTKAPRNTIPRYPSIEV
jgi:hypothetical protein